jgi:hypothetical protein
VDDVDDLRRALERERHRADEAQALIAELEARLMDAEARLARVGELELELRDLGATHRLTLDRHRAERDELRELLARSQSVEQALKRSLSWRVTAPLRRIKPR